jgi:hypothetical protein
VRVATFAQRSISGATLGIALGGDTCPVIDRVAQSDVRSVALTTISDLPLRLVTGAAPDSVRSAS